jgi:Ribbon-helix-helix protein, copG family
MSKSTSESRFDDIFSAASNLEVRDEPVPKSKPTKSSTKPSQQKTNTKPNDFWADFEDKDDRTRLNVDIPNELNERLSAKARKLGQPKTALVRRLIEWALDEDE